MTTLDILHELAVDRATALLPNIEKPLHTRLRASLVRFRVGRFREFDPYQRFPRRSTSLALYLLILIVTKGCATPTPSWIEVSSPRFVILSTMSEQDTKRLARELEQFHALIHALTGAGAIDSAIPTRIFVFSLEKDYLRFGSETTAGYFNAGLRENHIVLSGESDLLTAKNIVLHEYVHFTVRNGTSTSYPIWYDEGFAELLSTATAREDQIAIGLVPPARYSDLAHAEWIPLSRIISGKRYVDFSKAERSMFYAESWALVHYLTLGRREGTNMARDLESYLLRVGMGIPAEEAFEKAFGESIAAVESKIQVRPRQFPDKRHPWRVVGIPIAALRYDRAEPSVRIPEEDEVALRLGQLSLARGDSALAETSFLAAISHNPINARAHAGLGDALKFQGHWHRAEPHFRRAAELDPADALNQLDLAQYLYDLAFRPDQSGQRAALLQEAWRICLRSREIDSSIPEVWAQLGRIELALGKDRSQAIKLLEEAFDSLPSSPQLRQILAEAYVATGQDEIARKLLNNSTAVHASDGLEKSLDEQIAEIRKRLSTRRSESGTQGGGEEP